MAMVAKKRSKKPSGKLIQQNQSSLLDLVLNNNARMAQQPKDAPPLEQRPRESTARKFL